MIGRDSGSPDGYLVAAEPRARDRSRIAHLWDRVLMADIGLTRTLLALRVAVCMSAGMLVGWAIASALGLPPIVGLLVGAEPAFVTCQLIADDTARRIALRTAVAVVPFVVALSVSMALHDVRVVELIVIVVLLFAQFALRGWVPWGQDASMVLFMGYLCGLLLPIPTTGLPVLSAIAAGSLAVTILLRSLLFRPSPYRALRRTRRALVGWSVAVLTAAVTVLGAEDPRALRRARRRLRRRLDRLQEVALTADGLLADPMSTDPGDTAGALHRLLFDTHQAVDGLGRSADALVRTGAAADVRSAVRRAYAVVLAGGNVRGDDAARLLITRFDVTPSGQDGGALLRHTVHRIALQLGDLATVGAAWRAFRETVPRSGGTVPFSSAVELFNGRPKGAPPVLEDVLAGGGLAGPWRRVPRVSAPFRAGIQAALAVAITEPIALAVGGSRYYWGVVGVMVIIIGTNTTHERVRKAVQRVVGNLLGGIAGIGLVALLGTAHPALSLAIVVVALAIGTYGFGGVYALWAGALVVVLCQVYAFSGTFSDALIPLRIAENLLGAAAAVLVTTLVLPVTTNTLIRSAVRRQLGALRAFVLAVGGAERAPQVGDAADRPDPDLLTRSLAIDAATYQLDAVLKPVVRVPTGGRAKRDGITRTTLESVAAIARELAGRARGGLADVPPAARDRLAEAVGVLASSIDALSGVIGGRHPDPGTDDGQRWVRASGLLDDAERALGPDGGHEPFTARLHLLARIDDALAVLADAYGMAVAGASSAADAPTARARRSARLLAGRLGARPGERLATQPVRVQRGARNDGGSGRR
ncbi:FUSC family protein [Curtobacterium ammoniigenes]|uniref:FUSC family protein n=1 Tax=Curtobacterium ammoniigenes TaxID=395387 RepID=UPI000835F15D|nr:FUSC family protein [Curtobacterium ammoniigenes]